MNTATVPVAAAAVPSAAPTPITTTTATSTVGRGTALGVGFALASTVTVFVVGNLGAPIRVVTGWSPDGADLTLAEVVGTASFSVLLGGLVLWLLERRRPDRLRLWELAAVTVAVLSALPLLGLDIDAASKISLVSMHLLTGASAITAHRIVRRSRRTIPPLAR